MTLERRHIDAAFSKLVEYANDGDWNAWVDHFSEDCSFLNVVLPEPIRGREGLRETTKSWPRVTNHPEWVAIDGDRLTVAWNEHHEGMPERGLFRGVSTYVFDSDGLVCDYEGMFDTLAMANAWKAAS